MSLKCNIRDVNGHYVVTAKTSLKVLVYQVNTLIRGWFLKYNNSNCTQLSYNMQLYVDLVRRIFSFETFVTIQGNKDTDPLVN